MGIGCSEMKFLHPVFSIVLLAVAAFVIFKNIS